MRNVFTLLLFTLISGCSGGGQAKRNQVFDKPLSIETLSIVKTSQGYGMKVTAEVKNIGNKKITNAKGKFVVRKNGSVIDTHTDPFSSLEQGETTIIDAYFDYKPDEVEVELSFEN